MKKTSVKISLVVISCIAILVFLALYKSGNVSALDKNIYRDIKTFNEVFDMVKKNYVDEVDKDKKKTGGEKEKAEEKA